MTSYPIQLLDVAAGSIVEAELHDDIAEKQLIDWQFQWRPAMQTYLKRLAENGISPKGTAWPQSWHWDWRDKMNEIRDLLGHTGYSVVCRDVTQGMMRLDLVSKQARHQTQRGKPLVYVDYLEVAPWNWREEYADPPIYRLVGSVLTHAAFTRSVNEGFKGRVGLHSLPQAVPFYERGGFTNFGTHPDEFDGKLPYFEATPEAADAYLKGDLQ